MTSKAAQISLELHHLLAVDISLPMSPFHRAWPLVPTNMQPHLRRLVATVVLSTICAWNFRFGDKVAKMPLELVWFVQGAAHEPHPKRMEVAKKLLRTADADLAREAPFTDIPIKMKKVFAGELKYVAETGRCPVNLFLVCSLLRARMAYETQDLEGWNSIVQLLTSGCFNRTRLPMTSDRLKNKVGDRIAPQECSDMHDAVNTHMKSEAHWKHIKQTLKHKTTDKHINT